MAEAAGNNSHRHAGGEHSRGGEVPEAVQWNLAHPGALA
jgi:hypothetical protein